MTSHVFEQISWDRSRYAERTFLSSDSVPWSSVLVEDVLNHAVAEEHVPTSDDFQLALVVAGRGLIEARHGCRWVRAPSQPGRLAMTAPGRPLHLRWWSAPDERQRTLHVAVPRATLSSAAESLGMSGDIGEVAPDFLDVTDPVAEATILALRSAAERGVDRLYADAAAWFLAVHVLERWSGAESRMSRVGDARVTRALDYVHDQLGATITVDAMAAVAGLSPYHFIRVFRGVTGETPYRYVMRARLETAARRLRRESVSVTELALDCGFGSSSRFTAAFGRHYGVTPTDYRTRSRR